MNPTSEELPTHEWQRARAAFSKVMGDTRWVRSNFELQNMCAELNVQPTLEEVERGLAANDGAMDFEGLLCFLKYMKAKFQLPEPADHDTVLCFVAVGGSMDKRGSIEAETLKQACMRFDLAIDIDRLVDQSAAAAAAADPGGASQAGMLTFRDFEGIWHSDAAQGDAPAAAAPHPMSMMHDDDDDDDAGGRPAARLALGMDYQQLVERETKRQGLPMPRGRRPTDLLSPKSRARQDSSQQPHPPAVTSPGARVEGRRASKEEVKWFALSGKLSAKPPGDPPPGGAAPRQAALRKLVSQSMVGSPPSGPAGRTHSLRAKGVPALLWGGAADGGDAADAGGQHDAGARGGRRRRGKSPDGGKRRLLPAPPGPGTAPHKSSPQAILGAQTRVVGSKGLFVDDPPRLPYPQPTGVPTLPPIRGRGGGAADGKSRIVLRIERRMEELGKKKNQRYRNVASRLHEPTLSSRTCPHPPSEKAAGAPRPHAAASR